MISGKKLDGSDRQIGEGLKRRATRSARGTTRRRDDETTRRRDDETTGRRDDGTMGRRTMSFWGTSRLV
jgi:hypothetical protein